jgi:hypothetical protein
VNLDDSDLLKLRKDIERVRKHEEKRRSEKAKDERVDSAEKSPREEPVERRSVPIAVRLRRILEALFGPPDPSIESLEAIPECLVTLLQAIREQPKFEEWLLAIEALPPITRNQQLEKMSSAFRIEDGTSTIADGFDRLRNPILFKAFCQTIRDQKQVPI